MEEKSGYREEQPSRGSDEEATRRLSGEEPGNSFREELPFHIPRD